MVKTVSGFNNLTVSDKLTLKTVVANGSVGTSGQVLTSNGSGNAYWSTLVGVNTSAQYTFTNTINFSNSITIDNNKNLNFRTVNTSAQASFVQQSDDNFVMYTTNSAYGQRAVWSIFANSSSSNLNFSVRTQFNGGLYIPTGVTLLDSTGSQGSAGQILASNGSGNVYWVSPSVASVNTSAQYTWTNTHTFQANVSFTGNGIGITSNTGAIYVGGISDANWKIGRNLGVYTKWRYTNNSLDIAVANSNLEGFTIGNSINPGNAYFETGFLGTFIASNVTIGNSSSNVSINSTAFSGTSNNSSYLGGVLAASYVQNTDSRTLSGNISFTGANLVVLGTNTYITSNVLIGSTASFYSINGQANASGGNFIANAYATLSGAGGNYLAFGQQTNFSQWIQSGFSSAGTPVYYNIILNPLGGNIGINNTAPTDRLSVNGNTYIGANLTVAGANLIVSTGVISGNGTSITSVNAIALNGQPASYYTNATNITTGTLPYAQIPANIVNTTGSFTLSGNTTLAGTNTVISSNLNVTGTFINVASAFVANSTGAYHTGTMNAASHTVGTAFTANATVVNAVSYYAGTTLIGNTTGPYGKTEGNLNVNSSLISNTLLRVDNRSIVANDTPAGYLRFGFTSFAVNNTSPYGDFLQLRSYTDSSGGSDNLLVFNKSTIGVRVYQAAWTNSTTGNTSAYTNYKDLAFTDGTNATGTWNITANNASNLGGTAAASYQLNSTLNANIASYLPNYTGVVNGSSLAVGTSTIANSTGVYTGVVNGSSITVGTAFTANATVVNAVSYYAGSTLIGNTTGPYGKTEGNLNVNSALTANNSTNLGGTAAASYQLNSTLNANIASYLPTYTGVVNGSSLAVGTSTVSNATGLWTTGTVNAAIHQAGSPLTGTGGFYANTTTLIVGNNTINTTITSAGLTVNGASVVNSSVVNSAAHTISTTFIANTTGVYHTGTMNAASYTTGSTGTGTGGLIANVTTLFIGNNTVNAFLNTTQLNINAVTIANTTGVYTGTINAASHTVGTSTIANSTGIYTGIVNATTISTGSVNVINASGLTTTANVSIGAAGDLIITAGAGISANGGFGTSGQVLTSNASSIYWSTIAAGATLNANNTETGTFYFGMANTTSGTWSNAVVSTTKISFVPNTGALTVNGSISATTKSFLIDHPTKSGMKLRYASLEGPENGVYVRGKINGYVIELPDYWTGLVDEDTITVQLTAIGEPQNLYVVKISDNQVFICGENGSMPYCYYTVYGERKDVDKLIVEY
jgi:hypothetical protein